MVEDVEVVVAVADVVAVDGVVAIVAMVVVVVVVAAGDDVEQEEGFLYSKLNVALGANTGSSVSIRLEDVAARVVVMTEVVPYS